jgi:hypothetical protein
MDAGFSVGINSENANAESNTMDKTTAQLTGDFINPQFSIYLLAGVITTAID